MKSLASLERNTADEGNSNRPLDIRSKVSSSVGPSNGSIPVSMKYAVTPTENMSQRWSYLRAITSGATKLGEPVKVVIRALPGLCFRARPKSISFSF